MEEKKIDGFFVKPARLANVNVADIEIFAEHTIKRLKSVYGAKLTKSHAAVYLFNMYNITTEKAKELAEKLG